MNSLLVLNDKQWLQLLEQVARTFNEVTLSRGFTDFKQQHVTSLNMFENRVVQAKVSGAEDCLVMLKLDELGSSSCTCPAHTSCKHVAAALMELADRMGYPASHIVSARHQLKRSASNTLDLTLKQLPGMDVNGWHSFLDSYTSLVTPTYNLEAYVKLLREQLHKLPNDSILFSAIDWIYFDLHQELFILRKLREQQTSGSVNYYSSMSLYRIYDEFHAWLKYKTSNFNMLLSKDHFKQTLRYLRQQLAVENDHSYLDYGVYTAMWKYGAATLPEAGPWISQELEELKQQIVDSTSVSLSAAQAFLYLQQSKGEEAWAALSSGGSMQKATTRVIIPFFEHIALSQDWPALLDWLVKTATSFYGKRSSEMDIYLEYWKKTIDHLPEAETELWSILEDMLPHSTRMIEDMLYEQRKWKAWVEMQILREQEPFYHRVSVLQPIEKEDPEALLPYYHQAIEHYVSLKNRHDYKQAVKLLKRLAKVYKKMKQIERWDHFLSGFTERYSRLRALHEELKKGKLLE
jgi:hypothetical protein